MRPEDSRGNAVRVRDRTGWAMIGGFVLMERADASDGAADDERFVAIPHFWNATPRGLWLDATPRAHNHLQQMVLVEFRAACCALSWLLCKGKTLGDRLDMFVAQYLRD